MKQSKMMPYITAVSSNYFDTRIENIHIQPLTGGYSSASNLKLQVRDKVYVLRIMSELETPLKRKTEVHALTKASVAQIAPTIHWISDDGCAILMDYIAGETLTLEKSRKQKVITKISNLMRKTHVLQKNAFHAPSFEGQMEEYYKEYSKEDPNQTIWKEAILIIAEGAQQLQSLHAPHVNTHGDLNPRNILVSNQGVYFIDWGDGMYTDPFHDVAFFSIMMNYNLEEEAHFMECYLEHSPTHEEKKRFQIAKKMNFARLTLSGQGIGNQLNADQKKENHMIEPHSESIKEWSYYAKTFADDNTPLSAHFFWGQAQTALKAAKAIDTAKVE